MSARIRPLGQLKQFYNGQAEVQVAPGKTVRQLLAEANIRPEIVAGVIVNGELRNKDYCIQDGDEVKLMAVMSGG